MGHLLLNIATTTPDQFVPHTETTLPSTPPTTSINASSRSALLVESDESLLKMLRRYLKDMHYTVRTASNTEEALRLYHDFHQFNVVLIDYYIPESHGHEVQIDCCSKQTAGTDLAKAILNIDRYQGIIFVASDFQSAADVPRPADLKPIPVLVEISLVRLRIALEAIEVLRAIRALTIADQLKLQQFAKLWIRGIGHAASGRDWQDLMQEAMFRTLLGAADDKRGRHWNKKVDLVRHLAEAMRSIANSWKRQFAQEENTFLSSELQTCDSDGEQYSPLDNVASAHVLADDRLIERAEEDRILATLRDDTDASRILAGWMDGLKKSEILLNYGLDEKTYAAVVRRIRMKLLGTRGGNHEG
jgi:CheY-like chemotaxis protein